MKLSGRLGSSETQNPLSAALSICPEDYEFFRSLYDAYRNAEPTVKQGFVQACENLLNLSRR